MSACTVVGSIEYGPCPAFMRGYMRDYQSHGPPCLLYHDPKPLKSRRGIQFTRYRASLHGTEQQMPDRTGILSVQEGHGEFTQITVAFG